jgi:hypothetical protein
MDFEENYKELCENNWPYLFQMFEGRDKLPTRASLNVILGELFTLVGKSDKSIDFVYGNGKCGHAIISNFLHGICKEIQMGGEYTGTCSRTRF